MVHNVKSAIILAAGRGKRLNSLTTDRPKSLLKVRGQVLIERLIEQLQAHGIYDIYVVTGYKHLMFDYLNEKYGVELVYNKKWFCTNNIVSFIKGYEARPRISNTNATIILDSDLYIEDESVFQSKIDTSGYYVEYSNDVEKCSKEWVVDILGAANRRITRVTTNGSKDHGYVLRSLSFWTPMDIQKIYEFAKDAIKDGKNMQCYIDNIPCVMHFNKFTLKPYVSETSAMLEIDTELEYEQANKENNDEENS